MARFNAEIDDELHRQFGDIAKARGTTMRGLFLAFVEGLIDSDRGADPQKVAVFEIRLDPGVEAMLEQTGQRVSVRVGRTA